MVSTFGQVSYVRVEWVTIQKMSVCIVLSVFSQEIDSIQNVKHLLVIENVAYI